MTLKPSPGDEQSRRTFVKKTATYVVPAILTLHARPAFAQQGSPTPTPQNGGNNGGGNNLGGNNGVGNGMDPQPPGNPRMNDGPGTGPGNPGNQGGRGRGPS